MNRNFAHNEIRVKRIFADGLWNIVPERHTIQPMIHRLGELLKERGSKTRLAKKIGKPESIISDLCSGNDRLNDDLIKLLCDGLEIPIWQLFVDPREVIPKKYIDLMDKYERLSPDGRRLVDGLFLSACDPPTDTARAPSKTKRSAR